MELLVSVNKKSLDSYLNYTNSFLVGLKDFSVNYYELSLEEIKDLLNKYQDINLFISINKNIFNKDLDDLEYYLKEIDKLPIKGILFYDLSILSLVKRLGLQLPLCYHQTHMVTNYNICNYYYDKGVKMAYPSTEITVDEIKEISHKSKMSLMTYFIGHPIISHSKRKLVSNYLQYINKKSDKKIHSIYEKNQESPYFIKESQLGTDILTGDILNGTKAFILLKNTISYGILDNQLIADDVFLRVLELYSFYLNQDINEEELESKVEGLIGTYTGFFFKKTIYKVK